MKKELQILAVKYKIPKQPCTHKSNPIRRVSALVELRDEKAEKKNTKKKPLEEEYSLSTYNVSLCALGNLVLVRSRSKVVLLLFLMLVSCQVDVYMLSVYLVHSNVEYQE
ncbi:unnamed protein product [Rhizopus microsporus]